MLVEYFPVLLFFIVATGIGIAALAEQWGAECTGRMCLRDDLAAMRKAAEASLENADVVVVTGGASVGEKDFAKAMFEPRGLDFLFSKVSIKPGKPVWLGRVGSKLIMGLPGNPTSALVSARLLLAPLLAGLVGLATGRALAWRRVPLASVLAECGARETFHRARRRRPSHSISRMPLILERSRRQSRIREVP